MGTLEEQIHDLQTRVSSLENLLAFYQAHSILPDKYLGEPIIQARPSTSAFVASSDTLPTPTA